MLSIVTNALVNFLRNSAVSCVRTKYEFAVEPEEVKSYEAGLKKCQDGLKDLKEKLLKNKESKIIKG